MAATSATYSTMRSSTPSAYGGGGGGYATTASASADPNNNYNTNNNASREVTQLRQDLSASQDIMRMLQSDNAALKAAVAHHKSSVAKEVSARQALVDSYEAKLRELSQQVEASNSEKAALALEVRDALNERERQAEAIADVRKSVDSRLTRLMEEVHRKDGELHKLQFAMTERDRDRERAQMLERMLASREENINNLLSQLTSVRAENATLSAELRHKTLLADQLTRAQEAATAAPPSPSRGGGGGDQSFSVTPAEAQSAKEILSILPLYRQWSGDLRSDLELVDDGLDAVMDVAVDLRAALQNGGGAAVNTAAQQHDRQRLHRMRQLEKERMKQQANLMLSAAVHSDDPQGVHIHAIRAIADHSRYEMERVKETVTSLADCLEQLQREVADGAIGRGGSGALMGADSRQNTGGAAGAEDSTIVTMGAYTQPVSIAGAPLTPSIVRMSATAAAAHTAEVTRLSEAMAAKDAKLLDVQREVFEWREKTSTAESQVRMLERELGRATQDVDSTRAELKRAEEEVRAAKAALSAAHSEHARVMEAQRAEHHAMLSQHALQLRTVEEDGRRALVEATEELQNSVRDLRTEGMTLQRRLDEALTTETRLRGVLEDSKQKRLEWKRAKETADEELGEVRNALTSQNRELRQAQEMVDSLSAELAHVKDVLDFEVQQQERRALMGSMQEDEMVGPQMMMMGSPTGAPPPPPSMFQQWKMGHRDDVRSAQAATSRMPRKVVVRRKA